MSRKAPEPRIVYMAMVTVAMGKDFSEMMPVLDDIQNGVVWGKTGEGTKAFFEELAAKIGGGAE